MSEVFDPLVKRMSYRKQKRWWNAFMLFYTRVDYTEDENESLLKEMALLSIGMFWVVLLNLPTYCENTKGQLIWKRPCIVFKSTKKTNGIYASTSAPDYKNK